MRGSGGRMLGYLAGTAGLVLAADQLSKSIVRHSLELCTTTARSCPQLRLSSLVSILRVGNDGSALGLAQGLWVWTVIAALTTLLIAAAARRAAGSKAACLAVGLLVGGGLGNLADRLLFGAVTDFLAFSWGPQGGIVINIADIALAVGTVIAARLIWKQAGRGAPAGAVTS